MRYIITSVFLFVACQIGLAQAMYFSSAKRPDNRVVTLDDREELERKYMLSKGLYPSLSDSIIAEVYAPDTVVSLKPLPQHFFLPSVYNTYLFFDKDSVGKADFSGNPSLRWIEEANANAKRIQRMQQSMAIAYPQAVQYNVLFLPEAIKKYDVVIHPEDNTVEIQEVAIDIPTNSTFQADEIKKKHWIRSFSASLLFSQAYVSPNWYQGGNNNVNSLLNVVYNVKLNQQYHPKLLFESTFQYKLGMNSAPDDSLRSYNVSEDLLQINSVFGYKAAKKWYYSVTGLFKTQVVNSYTKNTNTLRSAFLSPGELNIGLGMTYNTVNEKKTFSFDASISPFSYNLKICQNKRMDPTAFGIQEGKHMVSKFGSSLECKLMYRLTYNIIYNSRLFAFTDYERFYTDWENTVVFEINKFLTTQLFMNMRYDTATPRVENQSWKKFQLKEILSIGVTYRFSTTG